jgi:hypothetical protein
VTGTGPLAEVVAGLVQRLLDQVRDHDPIEATRLGMIGREADLPDLSIEALTARSRGLADVEVAVAFALVGAASPADEDREAVRDLHLLHDAVRWRRIELDDRPRLAFDPLVAMDAVASVGELLRDARMPHDERVRCARAAIERTSRVAGFLEDAGRVLAGVSAPGFEVAMQRLPGLLTLVRDVLPREIAALGLEAEVGGAREAGASAAEGLEAFAALLDELVDDRRVDWRVGPVHHELALRHAVGTVMDAQSIEDRARTRLTEVRAELAELASASWGRRFPGERRPSDDDELVRRVLDHVADSAVEPGHLLAEAGEALDEARAFTASWGLVDLPAAEGLRLEPMPPEQQGVAVAFITRPPPLRPELGSTYNLSPVPTSWDPERTRSFLREYHPAQLRLLALHEGYPGHFVQLSHAARHPRLARRVLTRPVFAEGWAVLMERVSLEAGFGSDGTSSAAREDLVLTQRKLELRVAANALLDLGMHAAAMTDADAMTLLTGAALQQRAEAEGKLQRAKVTCGQLTSYFAGAEELTALLRRERATPGFELGGFLRRVLSHGTPTVAIVADALADGTPAHRPFAPVGAAVGAAVGGGTGDTVPADERARPTSSGPATH